MKNLIMIGLALLLGVLLIWVADFNPGFVLLQYGSWSLETSLVVFITAMTVLLFILYWGLRSLASVKQAPFRLAKWNRQQKKRRAAQALSQGLIALEEGRWAEAERMLVRHAASSTTPLVHYVLAARAAQKQQATDRRDNYLQLAQQSTEDAAIAVGVVQAELQLTAGHSEQALATLQSLREHAPKHPYVLHLLQQLHQQLGHWHETQALLPDLQKRNVLAADALSHLSTEALSGQLEQALSDRDWSRVSSLWQRASSRDRQQIELLEPYIRGLIIQAEHSQAAELIEHYMKKAWSDALAYQYGNIQHNDTLKALAVVEKWLKQQHNKPLLLLSAGKLAQQAQLWAKAEEYLQSSLGLAALGETFLALAQVLTAQDKQQAAAKVYQQGLETLVSRN
jgi:HemY protein